jgi:hypothetical protein
MSRRRLSPGARLLLAVAVALVYRWLDPDGCVRGAAPGLELHIAAVFGAIVAAIEVIGAWLGTAAAAVASYLAAVVQWLAVHLAIFIKATGVVFAKSWQALKIVYADVLKPAVQWFDAHLKTLYAWLRKALKPLFDFLNRVRGELLALYKKYVRPVLDVIDYTRAGLRILGDLGIDWARALDRRLAEFESVISENFRRILSYVNEAIDVLNAIVTVDRLFQRLPFLRTLQRDTRFVLRVMVNARDRPLTDFETARLGRFGAGQPLPDLNAQLARRWKGEQSDAGDVVDALAAEMVKDWTDYATSAFV